jgi:ABC-type transport system substrate-binding protein
MNWKIQQFRAASVDSDAKRRIQLYQEIEELIVQDAPWIFLCQRNTEMIRNPWLKGFRPYGFWPALRLESTWLER